MKKDQSIKILSFNIWGLPFWPINKRGRVSLIIDYLRKLDADIICIQEAFDAHYRKLILKEMSLQGYHVTDGKIKKHRRLLGYMDMTGGLITFSKFPVIRCEFTPFKSRQYSIVEWLGRKGVLETIVKTPAGPLRVINTHMYYGKSALASKMRLRELNTIVSFSKKNDHIPTVLAGDLNQDNIIKHDHIGILLENEFNHHVTGGDETLLPSYRIENPYVDNLMNRDKKSRRYDYILTKNIKKYNLEVHSYAPIITDKVLSDHDPVLMSLMKK